jgi:hypothetical protein
VEEKAWVQATKASLEWAQGMDLEVVDLAMDLAVI